MESPDIDSPNNPTGERRLKAPVGRLSKRLATRSGRADRSGTPTPSAGQKPAVPAEPAAPAEPAEPAEPAADGSGGAAGEGTGTGRDGAGSGSGTQQSRTEEPAAAGDSRDGAQKPAGASTGTPQCRTEEPAAAGHNPATAQKPAAAGSGAQGRAGTSAAAGGGERDGRKAPAAGGSQKVTGRRPGAGRATARKGPAAADPRPRGAAAISVRDLGVKGPRGWAFRGVNADAEPGALVALAGPSGSGRTCLLLALTGRMKVKEGHADVAGLRLPRKMAAVRRISALAHVPGVSDLDPAFTVAEHLLERALLRRRFDGSPLDLLRSRSERAAENRRRIDGALKLAGLDPRTLPKGERTAVRDLERLEALRLSLALALITEPRLLAVDDTDLKLGEADESAAWSALRAVADSGVTVLAVCNEAPEQADVVIRTDVKEGAVHALAETGRA